MNVEDAEFEEIVEPDPLEVIPFFVVGEDNIVTHTGSIQRLHLGDLDQYGAVHQAQAPMGRYRYIDNEFVEYEPEIPYDQARQQAYPSVNDQMDMLWHSMNNGDSPRVEPFYSSIKAIKEAYPKESA
jgi:hypothetical protein